MYRSPTSDIFVFTAYAPEYGYAHCGGGDVRGHRVRRSCRGAGGARVELSAEAVAALTAAREIVDALAAKPDPVYGVSTGFGALATRHISQELRAQLQRNIVRSHAAGMGPRVEREVVRALMFLRLKTVCSGHTGVRPEVAQTMADVLNAGITPVVHEYGSLGCSGDLAPSRTARSH